MSPFFLGIPSVTKSCNQCFGSHGRELNFRRLLGSQPKVQSEIWVEVGPTKDLRTDTHKDKTEKQWRKTFEFIWVKQLDHLTKKGKRYDKWSYSFYEEGLRLKVSLTR